MDIDNEVQEAECPLCKKLFPVEVIEIHVDRCIFLSEDNRSNNKVPEPKLQMNKRTFSIFDNIKSPDNSTSKRPKTQAVGKATTSRRSLENQHIADEDVIQIDDEEDIRNNNKTRGSEAKKPEGLCSIPLAEKMRPINMEDYIGQEHVMGKTKLLRGLLEKNEIFSMILWGPPGCGKTTLAHIIANHSKTKSDNLRFVKLSATMCGVNDVKEAVKIAKNEMKFNRKTILFMDEIHRFNKLQQDIFLPHVEKGTIILIGATTENPSFSLNSALLSRCRVICLEKLQVTDLLNILSRASQEFKMIISDENNQMPDVSGIDYMPKFIISETTLRWLAETSDGDARIALNSLQLAMQSLMTKHESEDKLIHVTLDDIKDGIKKSHLLYDRKGDQHYDIISALHKSIRASDDNAALYWCTRMIVSGEDPRFICRRLIRAASEDIGLADSNALNIAVSTLQSVQHIGMPESDCIIAQCAVYLARAPKSREIQNAYNKCKRSITDCKGSLPAVPLHLRNAPTNLMKELGYGAGYNLLSKDESGLQYLPEELEDVNYFSDSSI